VLVALAVPHFAAAQLALFPEPQAHARSAAQAGPEL